MTPKHRRHPFGDRPPRTRGEIDEQLQYLSADGERLARTNRLLAGLLRVVRPLTLIGAVALAAAFIWWRIADSLEFNPMRVVAYTWLGALALLALGFGIAWILGLRRDVSVDEVAAAQRRLAALVAALPERPLTDPLSGDVLFGGPDEQGRPEVLVFSEESGRWKVVVYAVTGWGALKGAKEFASGLDLEEMLASDEEIPEAGAGVRVQEIHELCDQLERVIAAGQDRSGGR